MSGTSVMGSFTQAVDATGLIIKKPAPPQPTPVPNAPQPTDTAVQQARADVLRQKRSFLKLNPTGAQGDLTQAPTVRRSLLGQG